MDCHYLQSEQFLLFVSSSIRNTTVELERVFTVRELSLIMTGRGRKLNCRGLKFFQQICWGLKLLINISMGSQTDFQLKEHV